MIIDLLILNQAGSTAWSTVQHSYDHKSMFLAIEKGFTCRSLMTHYFRTPFAYRVIYVYEMNVKNVIISFFINSCDYESQRYCDSKYIQHDFGPSP